jgi:hypothetical protein
MRTTHRRDPFLTRFIGRCSESAQPPKRPVQILASRRRFIELPAFFSPRRLGKLTQNWAIS